MQPSARKRGVMIALNDRIASAYYTMKVSANRMDTFRAIEQGQLGIFNNYTPHFFFAPARPTYWQHLDVSGLKELPKVDNFYMYTDVEESDFDHFIKKPGLQGAVIAGFGAVCLPIRYIRRCLRSAYMGARTGGCSRFRRQACRAGSNRVPDCSHHCTR